MAGFGTQRFVSQSIDVEFLKREVGSRFPFYELKMGQGAVAFFCNLDKSMLEDNFEALRRSLKEEGYIPLLRHEGGEDVIYVVPKPKRKQRGIWVNIALFIAAFITCTLTGGLLVLGEFDVWSVELSALFDVHVLWDGFILFAVPLLGILFIHEMGHYFISKYHEMETSLPFFIPVPPILPSFNIGTFGALISSHDPMGDRKSLFDVGLAGPLAGFLVAVPVTIIGIWMSDVVPLVPSSGEPMLGSSLLFWAIVQLVHGPMQNMALELSPVAFAGWVGLLITAINLLPAGQLDGGHVFRAVLGEKQKYASWLAVIFMVLTGWFAFAFLILLMGVVHPPPLNDDIKIDAPRVALFIVALLILVVCYVPVPIYTM